MALSKEEKIKLRKSVARDVLNQMKSGSIIASSTYGRVSAKNLKAENNDVQLQKILKKSDTTCEVCGIGALFISYVKKKNDVIIGDLCTGAYSYLIERPLIEKKLKSLFSMKELFVIESAFECNAIYSGKIYLEEFSYYRSAIHGNKRLEIICKNIIKYGKFVPKEYIKACNKHLGWD